MRIQKRLKIGYILVITVILINGIISLFGTGKIIQFSTQEEIHYEQMSTMGTEIVSYVKRAEGHALLYLILERADDRQKFYERMAVLKEKINDLGAIAPDSYTKETVREFLDGHENVLSKGMQLFSLLDKSKNTGIKIDLQKNEKLISEFHQTTSGLREKAIDFSLQHLQHLHKANRQSQAYSDYLLWFLFFQMCGSILLILLLGRWGRKAITLPIDKFTQAVEKFQQGDQTYQLEYDKPDELGLFIQTLYEMRENLVANKARMIQSAKLSSMGEIATGVGHELKQPLSTISLSTELAEESLDANDYSNVRNLLRLIHNQANRASKIIDHMKIFGKDSTLMELEDFQVNEIIENVFILIAEQLKLRDIMVEKQLEPNLPYLQGNPIQIEQIILNLIVNARNAMENTEEKKLTIKSFSDDSSIILEIADSGCGIADNLKEQIFEPFYTTTETGQGTGLGLSICSGIMAEHHGQISVESTVGKGTRFRLVFPLT